MASDKTLVFKYPNSSGELKDRVVIPITEPADKYFGVDISELDFEDQALFSKEMAIAAANFKEAVNNLMLTFDLKHRYRAFFPDKMVNLTIEEN